MTLVCTVMWCEEPPFVLHVRGYIDVDVCERGVSVCDCWCEDERMYERGTSVCVCVCVCVCVLTYVRTVYVCVCSYQINPET